MAPFNQELFAEFENYCKQRDREQAQYSDQPPLPPSFAQHGPPRRTPTQTSQHQTSQPQHPQPLPSQPLPPQSLTFQSQLSTQQSTHSPEQTSFRYAAHPSRDPQVSQHRSGPYQPQAASIEQKLDELIAKVARFETLINDLHRYFEQVQRTIKEGLQKIENATSEMQNTMSKLDEWGRGALSRIASFIKGEPAPRPSATQQPAFNQFPASQFDQGSGTSQPPRASNTFTSQQPQSSDTYPEIGEFSQYFDNMD